MQPYFLAIRVCPHRASAVAAAASRSIGIHGDTSLKLGNWSGTDFQASQCVAMGSNLMLRLTLDARCIHSLRVHSHLRFLFANEKSTILANICLHENPSFREKLELMAENVRQEITDKQTCMP